jgi:hypothetical protein
MLCCFSRPNSHQIPPFLAYNFKRMWCTHGSAQASRGEGRRDKDCRFTGCEADFLVRSEEVISEGQASWKVCVVPDTEVSPTTWCSLPVGD